MQLPIISLPERITNYEAVKTPAVKPMSCSQMIWPRSYWFKKNQRLADPCLIGLPHCYLIDWANALVPPTPFQGCRNGNAMAIYPETSPCGNRCICRRFATCPALQLLPVALERLAGKAGFGRFAGGQMAGLNAFKNRWLGHVAARVVASCLGKACRRVWRVWSVWRRANSRLWTPLKTDGWGM